MDPQSQFRHNPDCIARGQIVGARDGRGDGVLSGWMFLVGCASHFCWEHDSLRGTAGPGGRLKWCERAPAMAAGLTDDVWTMHELLSQPIPLPPWVAPKRRGRPPKRSQNPEPVAA